MKVNSLALKGLHLLHWRFFRWLSRKEDSGIHFSDKILCDADFQKVVDHNTISDQCSLILAFIRL